MATDADLIAKYRQYNPNYDRYTDEEITQIGLPGFEQPMGINTVPNQFTYRNQFMNDVRNLPSDIRNSLGQTKDALVEDFSGLQNVIGSGIDKFSQGIGSLKDKSLDLGKMAISGIGNAIMPGLGFLMANLKPEPLFRQTLANSRMANPLGTRGFETIDGTRTFIDGVSDFGGFTTDDLGRIVQTGSYNTPENVMAGYNAGFDLAGSALDRIGTIQNTMRTKGFTQQRQDRIDALKTAAVASAQAKRQAYQDKIDRARDAAAREKARAKSIAAGYGGGNDNDRPTTGPTAVGAGMGMGGGYASDYGFLKDGGSVGLASMFTRRG